MSLTVEDYDFVRHLVARESALSLGDSKGYLVEARLAPVAEREGCGSVAELIARMRLGNPGLHADVVQSLTTNETSFFRDIHPFDALREVILPEALAARGRVNVWSAAASTGQEAYSLAMVAADSFPDAIVTILGTDLSRDVIARAQEGVFTQLEVNRGLPAPMLIRHLERVGSRWRVRDDVRRRVRFQQMNLAKPWPALPRMDLVLLRNVLIYFDAPAKRAALAQVARVLSPPGLLLLGGAETTLGISPEWERRQVGRTTFYRPTAPVDAPWQQR